LSECSVGSCQGPGRPKLSLPKLSLPKLSRPKLSPNWSGDNYRGRYWVSLPRPAMFDATQLPLLPSLVTMKCSAKVFRSTLRRCFISPPAHIFLHNVSVLFPNHCSTYFPPLRMAVSHFHTRLLLRNHCPTNSRLATLSSPWIKRGNFTRFINPLIIVFFDDANEFNDSRTCFGILLRVESARQYFFLTGSRPSALDVVTVPVMFNLSPPLLLAVVTSSLAISSPNSFGFPLFSLHRKPLFHHQF